MTDLPSIADVSQAMRQAGMGSDPSELHGALCGWLAGGGENDSAWPARVLADDSLPAAKPGALEDLRLASVEQLEDRGFGFELLLPESDGAPAQRAEALFDWCRGFLGGFGMASGANPPLSEEAQEALLDVARLAQAAPESGGDADEDEDALAEIEEFVRVAVLLLHGDCVMAPRHRQSLN